MVWAKVDDQWFAHRKVVGLSLAARGLWTTTLSWSCAQRTDHLPSHMVEFLAQGQNVGPLAEELVESGMWHPNGDGWVIHDWAEYQQQSLSEKRAQAGRKGAEKRWSKQENGEDSKSDHPDMANDSNDDLPDMANAMAGARPGPSRPEPDQRTVARDTTDDLIRSLAKHVERNLGRKPRTPDRTWKLEAVNLLTVDRAPPDEVKAAIRFLADTWWDEKITNFRDLRNHYPKIVSAMNKELGPPPADVDVCDDCEQPIESHNDVLCEAGV